MSLSLGFASWQIVPHPDKGRSRNSHPLPSEIVTWAPALEEPSLPGELALLLPAQADAKTLIERIVAEPHELASQATGEPALGLFLANPFINPDLEAPRLIEAGARCIANLPSVAQHDEDFAQQLSDVQLDNEQELKVLARFKGHGLGVIAVVSDRAGASGAAAISADAVLVMPRTADFAAGFPSLRQRGSAAQTVASTLSKAGWRGPLLGLGDAGEAERPVLWPDVLDGIVCRPRPR